MIFLKACCIKKAQPIRNFSAETGRLCQFDCRFKWIGIYGSNIKPEVGEDLLKVKTANTADTLIRNQGRCFKFVFQIDPPAPLALF